MHGDGERTGIKVVGRGGYNARGRTFLLVYIIIMIIIV